MHWVPCPTNRAMRPLEDDKDWIWVLALIWTISILGQAWGMWVDKKDLFARTSKIGTKNIWICTKGCFLEFIFGRKAPVVHKTRKLRQILTSRQNSVWAEKFHLSPNFLADTVRASAQLLPPWCTLLCNISLLSGWWNISSCWATSATSVLTNPFSLV